jgi:hypothetical protein
MPVVRRNRCNTLSNGASSRIFATAISGNTVKLEKVAAHVVVRFVAQ